MASSDSAERVIPWNDLKSLVKFANESRTKAGSISGAVGERVAAAVENKHLHRQAFGVVAKLDRMEADRRNDAIRSLRLYLDLFEEKKWSVEEGHTGDLVDEAEREKQEEIAARAAENAKNLGGIGELPEEERQKDIAAAEGGVDGGKAPRGRKPRNQGGDGKGSHRTVQ